MNAPLAQNKVTNVSPLRKVMKSNESFFLFIEMNERLITEILCYVFINLKQDVFFMFVSVLGSFLGRF